jgi:hypothetical protein
MRVEYEYACRTEDGMTTFVHRGAPLGNPHPINKRQSIVKHRGRWRVLEVTKPAIPAIGVLGEAIVERVEPRRKAKKSS